MSVRGLRWFFVAALGAVVVLPGVEGRATTGISAEWINGYYRFTGGTTPGAIALALLVIGLYLVLLYSSRLSTGQPLPGLLRRFVAFWCDFILAMVVVVPIVGIFSALTEWRRTGVFAWTFVRTAYAAGDTLQVVIGSSCGACALVLYFAIPLVRCRPSPGCCILGYQVLPQDGTTMTLRTAVLRTLLGLVAVSTAYVAPFASRDRESGQFWLDKVFRTRAVRLA